MGQWLRINMELTVILLNWNAAADTIRCLQAIGQWPHLQPVIIVVDNASADGSAEKIAAIAPHVHLIRNTANLGFAGGNNRGIQAALALGNAPILLLNNDAQMEEQDVLQLLETLEANPQIGLIGPLLFDGENRERLLAAGSTDPALHHQSHNHRLPSGGPVHRVECIPGTALLIRAEVFRLVGLLEEAYFFGSEVADFCLLAARHGYQNAIDTRARAYHTLERSSRFRSTLYPYYIIRNRFLLIKRLHRNWKLGLYGFWTLYSLALALKVQWSGQVHTARAIRLGLQDGLLGRFGGQNERVLAWVLGQSR